MKNDFLFEFIWNKQKKHKSIQFPQKFKFFILSKKTIFYIFYDLDFN